jgi:hypothetical protein
MLRSNKICAQRSKKRLTVGFSCFMILFALQKLLRGQRVFP